MIVLVVSRVTRSATTSGASVRLRVARRTGSSGMLTVRDIQPVEVASLVLRYVRDSATMPA
ncbi:hypothetical protein SGLAM104S_07772 [Streptomyces glaucescens]